MVLDTAIYHPTLTKLIKFLDKTSGRDKAFRLAQYLVRFLAFYVAQNGYSLELAKLFKSLQSSFTFIRKGLRFLKPLNHLQDAAKAYDNKLADSLIRATVVLKNIAYFGYLSYDSIAFFKLLGVVSPKTLPKAPKYANWFWFIGLVAGLTNDLRKISISSSRLKALSSADEKEVDETKSKALELERSNATKRLVWDSLDLFIVLNNLNFINNSDGVIGLAGTFTSIFGVQDIWEGIKI